MALGGAVVLAELDVLVEGHFEGDGFEGLGFRQGHLHQNLVRRGDTLKLPVLGTLLNQRLVRLPEGERLGEEVLHEGLVVVVVTPQGKHIHFLVAFLDGLDGLDDHACGQIEVVHPVDAFLFEHVLEHLKVDHVLAEHPDQALAINLETTLLSGHVFLVLFVVQESAKDGAQQFLTVAPSDPQFVARLPQVLAVGKDAQGFVGDKLGVGVQILGRGQLLFVSHFDAVDGQSLHRSNHVEQHEVQLLHFLRAVVEGLTGAFDIAVLVLIVAKKNVQDLDPEVAAVQHDCELAQKYVAQGCEHWRFLEVFSPCRDQ